MHDLRYTLRMLKKQPGVTAVAILTLALGIGANTAIFSVVNAVLLRPLPYPQSDQLVILRERYTGPNGFESGSVSYPNYLDWRAAQHSFTDVGLVRREGVTLSDKNETTPPERISAARVTANYFSILQVPPRIGRDLAEKDDVPGAAKVALISERLWRSRFGSLPLALGQTVMIDGVAREIIGVVPERVTFPRNTDVFLPLADLRADHDLLSRGNHEAFSAIGRLKPNISLTQARSELSIIAADLARRYPDSNLRREISSSSLLEFSVGDYRHLLVLLLAAVGCVLLIACANVANLQLARGLARSRELAVRAALGASRWQLGRQILIESAVLALLGGIFAVIIAVWSLDTIRALAPANVGRFQETSVDHVVLLVTTGIAVITGLLVGAWPALRISRSESFTNELHQSGGRSGDGRQRQRTRAVLVVAQVALAVALLAASCLTLKSFWRAQQVPLGFNPQGILMMTVSLPSSHYDSNDKIVRFYDRLIEKIKAVPGVDSVAVCSNAPFDHNDWDSSFHIAGTPKQVSELDPISEMTTNSAELYRVLGMPVLRGRTFGEADISGRPGTLLIDELAAQKFFPGQDPIGKQIDDPVTIDDDSKQAVPLTIVGIVPHTRNSAPGDKFDKRNLPVMYFSASQFPKLEENLMVRARAGQNPHSLVNAIKDQIATLDPNQAVADVATMEENIGESLAPRRLTMTLLGVFAGLALSLACIGIYGVMALVVAQRSRELGIRLALGASRGDVFRFVLGEGMLLVGAGLVIGLVVAASSSRGLTSIVDNVSVWDGSSFGSAIIVLAGVAALACWLPARRATQIDPIVALRAE